MPAELNHLDYYRLPRNYADNGISWLEPTTDCNLRCEGCYRDPRGGHKTLEEVRAVLEGTPQHFEFEHLRFDRTPFPGDAALSRLELNGTPDEASLTGNVVMSDGVYYKDGEKDGEKESVHLAQWPEYDESKLMSDVMTIAVQVNGKVRGTFEIEVGADQSRIEEMSQELEGVKKHMDGAKPRKIIYIKGK